MSYIYCEEHCIFLPRDFPVAEERELMNIARVLFSAEQAVWKEFGGGTNSLAWRFRTAYEAWGTFCASWTRTEGRPNHEQIYAQERALFEMFTAAVSCVESLVYAIGAALSSSALLSLPFAGSRQKQCNPKTLSSWLSTYSAAQEIRHALDELDASMEWETLLAVRNRLSHRGNLPRIIYGAMGAELPPPRPIEFDQTTSSPRLSGDLREFDLLLMWLSLSVTCLLEVSLEFFNAARGNP